MTLGLSLTDTETVQIKVMCDDVNNIMKKLDNEITVDK